MYKLLALFAIAFVLSPSASFAGMLVADWPDVIKCEESVFGTSDGIYVLQLVGLDNKNYYTVAGAAGNLFVGFDDTTGAYDSDDGTLTDTDCLDNVFSIAPDRSFTLNSASSTLAASSTLSTSDILITYSPSDTIFQAIICFLIGFAILIFYFKRQIL